MSAQDGPRFQPGHAPGLSAQFIYGSGEMADLVRCLDWSASPLGAIDTWCETLRCAVNMVLASPFACNFFWGPEMVQIYNDAYAPLMGGKSPNAMGQLAKDCWAEAWEIIGPQLHAVLDTGAVTYFENVIIPILRGGVLQDVYWTYGYSPVCLPNGVVGGILITAQDTTDKVLAERELEQVMSATTDGILSFDRNWKITYINKVGQQILAPSGDILGTNFWESFPGTIYEDSPYVLHYNNAMDHRIPSEFEAFYPEPFNLTFSVTVRPAQDGIVLFFRDVTLQRRAEAALQESEARLSAIYGTSVSLMGLLSPDGTILDCNRAALQLGGTSREKLNGLRYWQGPWFSYTRGIPEIVQSAVIRAAQGEFVRQELSIARPSGKILTLDFSISPVRDAEGVVVFLVPEAHDITTLKNTRAELAASREELHWTVELSTPIPWTADTEGNILDFSRSFLELTGLPREQVLGKGWIKALHPGDLERVLSVWTGSLRSGEPVDVEYRLRTASQLFRWVRARANPRRDVFGSVVKWYGTIEDIDDRKTAEDAQIRGETLAAVERLATTIATEIRDPLEQIANLLELAQTADPDEAQNLIRTSDQELRRILAVTGQTFHLPNQIPIHEGTAAQGLNPHN